MNKTTEALKLAEEALEGWKEYDAWNDQQMWNDDDEEDLAAIREALAEPVKQEPVAWVDAKEEGYEFYGISYLPVGKHHLYAAPVSAKLEWVDLTDEEIATVVHEMNGNEPISPFWRDLIYEAIAAFKEKNK